MQYRCVVGSVAGFVQQLAVGYIARGYYFYVSGVIPEGKDPEKTDRKIMDAYGVDVSKWTRTRRKRLGDANVHYLRYRRFYVILANNGVHPFFAAEAKRLRDVRRRPISFMGYSIGCRPERGGGSLHASVRIHRDRYRELTQRFNAVAVHLSLEALTQELRSLPFEPYAPVRVQLSCLRRRINRRRLAAGLDPVPMGVLRLRRSSIKPFGPVETAGDSGAPPEPTPLTKGRL